MTRQDAMDAARMLRTAAESCRKQARANEDRTGKPDALGYRYDASLADRLALTIEFENGVS